MKTIREIGRLLWSAFREGRKDNLKRHAASLAYYLIFSLAPLFYIIIFIGGKVYEQNAVQGQVFYFLNATIGGNGALFLGELLSQSGKLPHTAWGILFGSAVLIYGAIGFYSSLANSFSEIYSSDRRTEGFSFWLFFKNRLLSLAFLIGSTFFLIALIFINLTVSVFRDFFIGFLGADFSIYGFQIFNFLFLFFVVALLFSLMYISLSNFKIHWKDAIVGALLGGFLFMIVNVLLSVYFNLSNVISFYGVGGSIVLILIWIYYSSQIFLFGAEVVKIHERQRAH